MQHGISIYNSLTLVEVLTEFLHQAKNSDADACSDLHVEVATQIRNNVASSLRKEAITAISDLIDGPEDLVFISKGVSLMGVLYPDTKLALNLARTLLMEEGL